MRDEFEGTHKIRQALEHGVADLDRAVVARLAQARENALNHQRIRVGRLRLAGASTNIHDAGWPRSRRLIAIAALTLGMVGTYYWSSFESTEENEEIDSALLTDELPIDAYTDHGFQAWLEHSSPSSSR